MISQLRKLSCTHLLLRGHKDVIFNLEWNPYEVNFFVSVGVKHIKFWTVEGMIRLCHFKSGHVNE